MEDSLGGWYVEWLWEQLQYVLILVVMEDSLGDGLIPARPIGGRLNPCCYGR